MKKRVLLCSLLGVISVCSFSQTKNVGINTEDPQGVFHIVSGKDDKLNQEFDEFIVDSEGNVGIGTRTPKAKLEIIGTKGQALRVKPAGVQTKGEIIASDAEGNFVAETRPMPEIKEGSIIQIETELIAKKTSAPNLIKTTPFIPGDPNIPSGSKPAVKISDKPLELTEGTWLIQLKYTTRTTAGSGENFKAGGDKCGRDDGYPGFDQYIWTLLYDENQSPDKGVLTTVGFATERSGACACTPQLTHVVKINNGQTMKVSAYASTSIKHNTIVYVDGNYPEFSTGKPYFRAVRIDQFK